MNARYPPRLMPVSAAIIRTVDCSTRPSAMSGAQPTTTRRQIPASVVLDITHDTMAASTLMMPSLSLSLPRRKRMEVRDPLR